MRLRTFSIALLLLPWHTLSAQDLAPTVAPGLTVPDGGVPWALERFQGKQQLVPIHHSTIAINNHRGENVAGSLAGSFFYKPKVTTELSGLHARTSLHDPMASIFLHAPKEADAAGDGPESNTAAWALVRATSHRDHRIFAKIRFTQLTGNAKRSDGIVETATETLAGGWLKLTPRAPLEPGEYAVMPIMKVQTTFSTVVYDFTLDPAAPNVNDAISGNKAP